MANLVPLKLLTDQQIEDAVRLTLKDGVDAQILADFVASVDWSGAGETSGRAVLLGKLENWTSLYLEGDLSKAEYKRKLLSTLSEKPATRGR